MANTHLNGTFRSFHFKNSVCVIWEKMSWNVSDRSPTFQFFDEQWQIGTHQDNSIFLMNYIQIHNLTQLCSSSKETAFLIQLSIVRNDANIWTVEREEILSPNSCNCLYRVNFDVGEKLMVCCRISCTESKVLKSDDKGLQTECSDAGIQALSADLSAAVETGQHSDVVLKLGEVTFPAHKVILSCRSKVFRAMFDHDCKENSDNVVDLVEMDVATAKSMLEYIYTGKIAELSSDNAIELYAVADRYCLEELLTQCREVMVGHVDADNMCEMAATADLHSDDALMEAVQAFFRANLVETFKSEKLKVLLDKNPHLFYKLVQEAVARDHEKSTSSKGST